MKKTFQKTLLLQENQLTLTFLAIILFASTHLKAQSFSSSTLQGAVVGNPTTLQFGPDGKLYVAQQGGQIKIFTINKNGANDYQVTNTETILLVKNIPNHNDDGSLAPSVTSRLVTGIYVTGTSTNPLIYIASSDPRFGAGEMGDIGLCTNSGIISKVYKESGVWKKMDLVRGLPRSEENHAPNGIQIDPATNTLFHAIGGSTNSGGVSRAWTFITEYALTACILSIDLDVIEAMPTQDASGTHPYKYDIPTLDDPTRPGNPDAGDPFGGNDGLNQGKIVPGGPVQVYAPGFRNPFDILLSKYPGRSGNLYTIDNGPNALWGGYPEGEGTSNVTNKYLSNEPGSAGPDANGNGIVANFDGLELIGNVATYVPGSYYGGHPVPIRANPTGAGLYTDDGTNKGWRNDNSDPLLPLPSDWPPVSTANPIEGDYLSPGKDDQSFISFDESVNGLCEYTASGALQGELLAAGYGDKIHRIKLNATGTATLNTMTGPNKLNTSPPFASGLVKPLDVTAQGDGDIFPGTVWTANYGNSTISVFEPQVVTCSGLDNGNDDDSDGYTNADEIDNGTDPCSGADKPNDWDGQQGSDLNDPDDDNDGILDTQDNFALDFDNGDTTSIPTYYALFNYDPGVGFFGLGFSGLMCNGTTDYLNQYDPQNLVAGGAVGAFTVYGIGSGDALKNTNTQENAFQYGVNVGASSDNYYTVRTKILAPFFNQNPKSGQSQGLFIGKGDQDNYIKLVLTSSGIDVIKEEGGISTSNSYPIGGFPTNSLELIFVVNKSAGTVQPYYRKDTEDSVVVGSPISLSGGLLNAAKSIVAVGAISTSSNSGTPFDGTWDYFAVSPGITFKITGVKNYLTSLVNGYVYPNPFSDKLNISFNSDKAREIKLVILDNTARIIKEIDLKIPEGKINNEINVSNLVPGVYYINVIAEKNISLRTFKIIKH